MTLSITHTKVSAIPDVGDATLVEPSDWNAAHTLTGIVSEAQGGTGISALGAGVATFLGTPSSANLAAALTDETGSGAAVFANTPTLVTPVIGVATGTSLALTGVASVGANAGTNGQITFSGSTSGTVVVKAAAAAGTGTVFQLPATNGTNTYVLQTDGTGVTSWVAAAGNVAPLNLGTNTVEQFNTTNAQFFAAYNTRTDAANYERGVFDWQTTANTLTVGFQKLGTGTDRDFTLQGAVSTSFINFAAAGNINYRTEGTHSFRATNAIHCYMHSGGVEFFTQFGYGVASGIGGTVTQITSRTTGVTINNLCGAITLVSAAGSATPASFTVTCSSVAANDVIIVNQKSGTDLYNIHVTNVAAGSFQITFFTTGGTTTEQPVFNYLIIKGTNN